jgi:hypothetical protein
MRDEWLILRDGLNGPNIEYIRNNDSHPGAQFNSEFHSLVKTEVAKLSAEKELPAGRFAGNAASVRAVNIARL